MTNEEAKKKAKDILVAWYNTASGDDDAVEGTLLDLIAQALALAVPAGCVRDDRQRLFKQRRVINGEFLFPGEVAIVVEETPIDESALSSTEKK